MAEQLTFSLPLQRADFHYPAGRKRSQRSQGCTLCRGRDLRRGRPLTADAFSYSLPSLQFFFSSCFKAYISLSTCLEEDSESSLDLI